jgi:hypothetical protein
MKKIILIAVILLTTITAFAQRIGVDRVDIALSSSCTTLNAPSGKLTLCADSVSGLLKCFNSGGTSCFPSSGSGLADPGSNGIVKRTSANVTTAAVAGTDYVTPVVRSGTSWARTTDTISLSTSQNLSNLKVQLCALGKDGASGGTTSHGTLTVFDVFTSGTLTAGNRRKQTTQQ